MEAVFGPLEVYSVLGPTALVVFSLVPLTITAVLLSPAAMELVTMLQDLLTVGAMVMFVDFTLHYSGPLSSIQAPCPLATPPLCCLMCCPKPTVSPVVARLILLPIRVTPVALVLNFLVNLYLTYSGVGQNSADGFFQVSN